MTRSLVLFPFLVAVASAQSPQLTSWYTQNSGKYARVYTTTGNRTNGNAASTWTNHSSPAYSDVYEVSYSNNWVYVKTTGLPSYVTGPWLNPQGNPGNFYPATQSSIRRFPRNPSVQAGNKDNTPAAHSGYFVNGLAAFNALDGWAWNGSSDTGGAQHWTATYYWHRVAPVAEAYNFDYTLGHQTPAGVFHNHQDPIALRYHLGDHVTYNSSTKNYAIASGEPAEHSPLIGWANDGYPIYGPYGYSSPLDPNSGVRRMVSGYVKRNGATTGVDSVITNNTTMPAWYTRFRTSRGHANDTPPARSTNTGTYPIGTYAQDWAYLGDLIKSGSTAYQLGSDFDLNEQNVRYCVTPEFPSGTWAYFVTLDSSNAATYPYVFGFEFYGDATGGTVASISESVTNHFTGGPNTPLAIPETPTVEGGTVSLTWNSVEGGSYSVETSTDQMNWTVKASGLTATGVTRDTTYSPLNSTGTEHARVTRTALATYDTTGVGSATVAQTATTSYVVAENNPPTLTAIADLTGATENQPFTISYEALAAAADEADADGNAVSFRIEAVTSGTLTKNGSAVTPGTTILSSGENLVWTPAFNASGTLAAFTVKAWDGSDASDTAVAVNVVVADMNDAPNLTSISTLTGAMEDAAFTITHATLAAAADESDTEGDPISFRIEAVSNGTLTKNGSAVIPGTTLLSSGESLVWTPAANANGTLAAFTVKAHDGNSASHTPVTVNVQVAAVNDAPTLTAITPLSGAVVDTPFTLTYNTLAAAADEADPDGTTPSFRIESVSAGTLTKGGGAVTPGFTLLASGESVVWTPPSGSTGIIAAFSVKAWDGALASSAPVAVNIEIAATASDPQLTTWFTQNSGKYARLYTTNATQNSGTAATTWSRGQGTQSSPVYADISEVNYSTNWVYIRTSNLASYTMGPWYLDAADTQLFGNYPANQAHVYRFPRTPVIPATKTATTPGAVGKLVNGVSLFDSRDTFSYDTSAGQDQSPTSSGVTGDGIWNRNAIVTEGATLDPTLAHQAGSHYHNHSHPIALRYQLGDHVDYNAATNTYSESTAPVTQHSPIVGWALDGLPIYGPYGYDDALDTGSGVRRMISGFAKRDGTNGTTAITVRQTLPAWAQRFQNRVTLTSGQYGPAVNTTYPLGHYIEDFDYRGDLGQTQGVDFDLNEYNVRWCATPEFPSGTWAYFTTIESDGSPAFPFSVGRQYYGSPTGGATNTTTMNADTPLTQEFIGGPNKALEITGTELENDQVTLTWNAVEGGTYSVDASTNNTTWTSKASGLTVSNATEKSNTHTALGSSGTEYARVNRTALATYDTNGFSTATVAQTATTSFEHPEVNIAPTLTDVDVLPGGTEDTDYTISYEALLAASDAADANGDAIRFRIEMVFGTLTKNGTPVTVGSTLLSSGESLVWTPLPNVSGGPLLAFSVKAFDGELISSDPIAVLVDVAAVNDAPELTVMNTMTGGTEDTSYTVTFELLRDSSDAEDEEDDIPFFRVVAVQSGSLTKNGVAVVPGETFVDVGESFVWTPEPDANGTLAAFTVEAWDGELASASPVQVNIELAAVNDPPILSSIAMLSGATEDTPFVISYTDLAAAADESDVEGDPLAFRVISISTGTLTKDGSPVTEGGTTLSAGESLEWTPAANAHGELPAFTVKADDGQDLSEASVQVTVSVAAVPDIAEWDGGSGSGAWSDAANWVGDILPEDGDSVRFTGSASHSVMLDADRIAETLTFGGDSAYSLAGNTLAVGVLATESPSSGSVTHAISSAMDLGASATADIAPSATLHLSGGVTGGSLEKSGTGTLILSGSAAMTATTVSEGTLQIGNSSATGDLTGDIENHGTLVFRRSNLHDVTGVISGPGNVIQNGGSTVRLAGGNTFTGTLTVLSGNVAIGNGGSGGSLATQSIVNGGNLIFNRTTDYNYGGAIGGTGTLFKVNTNTLTLTGANTYSGHTQLQGGVLAFESLQNLGTGSGTLFFNNATTLRWAAGNTADISRRADNVTARAVRFDVGGATFDTNGNDVTLTNSIGNGGSGGFTKTGAGTLTLSAAPAYAGNTTVNDGTLAVAAPGFADSSDVSVAFGKTLHLGFEGTDTIDELFLNGNRQRAGVWGAIGSGARYETPYLTGPGLLYVPGGVPNLEHWASTYGLTGDDALADADPDHDGLANLLEWVLGGNPDMSDGATIQPTLDIDGDHLVFSFQRSDDSEEVEDLELAVEYATNLSSWTVVEIGATSSVAGDVTVTVVENGDELDDITVRIPTAGNPRMFVRVSALLD